MTDAAFEVWASHRKTRFKHQSDGGERAIVTLSHPTLVYDLLVGIANRLAPPGKSRRRLARKLNCTAAMVPDALVCSATVYALGGGGGLIILLYSGGFDCGLRPVKVNRKEPSSAWLVS